MSFTEEEHSQKRTRFLLRKIVYVLSLAKPFGVTAVQMPLPLIATRPLVASQMRNTLGDINLSGRFLWFDWLEVLAVALTHYLVAVRRIKRKYALFKALSWATLHRITAPALSNASTSVITDP